MKLMTRVSAALLTTVGLATAASAQPRGITVYTDIDFNGSSETFTQAMPDLRSVGLNDTISSIRVPAGETWQICDDINFQGRCREISGRVGDLRNMNLNDQISSMRRVSGAAAGVFGNRGSGRYTANDVIVYTNPNYSGRSVELTGDTPDFRSIGLNDQVSSIEIPNGGAWEVCVDIDYGNQCTVLSNNVSDLGRIGWGDRISSIRRVDNTTARNDRYNRYGGNTSQPALIFYSQPNFRGGSRVLTRQSNADVIAGRGSLRLNGSGAWRLCDTYGDCATVDRDVPNIASLGLTDRITSVRQVATADYRRSR
jgi:hypothetical protein